MVLYHPEGLYTHTEDDNDNDGPEEKEKKKKMNEQLVEWAKLCGEAMRFEKELREGEGEARIEYNVFVVVDSWAAFEERIEHRELVAVDRVGRGWNYLDFRIRDREEVRVLTEASPVCENVWVSLACTLFFGGGGGVVFFFWLEAVLMIFFLFGMRGRRRRRRRRSGVEMRVEDA